MSWFQRLKPSLTRCSFRKQAGLASQPLGPQSRLGSVLGPGMVDILAYVRMAAFYMVYDLCQSSLSQPTSRYKV